MEKVLSSNIRIASRLLSDGSICPTELLEASLKRLDNTKKYNAFITLNEEKAKEQAIESSKRHKNKSPKSELDGITFAIKDNFCTKDLKTTCASKMLENFVPMYNATVCERLLEAGAILVGKTNLDEFAMGSGTVDSIFGPTKNVWGYSDSDNFNIAGGSSGGSSVAVATGTCFAAIGSDTGGSTRNPASYCGIVGLKPTYGLLSRLGLIPLVNSMDVPGILTRTVDDCVSVLNVVAGHDPKDSTSREEKYRKIRLPTADKISVKALKIGIPKEYNCEHLSNEVLETWQEVSNLLKYNGADIQEISMPNTEHSIVCYSILNQCEVASNMARYDGLEYGHRSDDHTSMEASYAKTRREGFNAVVKGRIVAGNYFLLTRNYDAFFNQALKVRRLILNDFDHAWEKVQMILTPTTLTTAPMYKDYIQKTNREQCALHDFCTQPANMAGIPAVSIPIKLSASGLPISLQLMGRNLSEAMLLAAAKHIEGIVQFPQFVNKTNS